MIKHTLEIEFKDLMYIYNTYNTIADIAKQNENNKSFLEDLETVDNFIGQFFKHCDYCSKPYDEDDLSYIIEENSYICGDCKIDQGSYCCGATLTESSFCTSCKEQSAYLDGSTPN